MLQGRLGPDCWWSWAGGRRKQPDRVPALLLRRGRTRAARLRPGTARPPPPRPELAATAGALAAGVGSGEGRVTVLPGRPDDAREVQLRPQAAELLVVEPPLVVGRCGRLQRHEPVGLFAVARLAEVVVSSSGSVTVQRQLLPPGQGAARRGQVLRHHHPAQRVVGARNRLGTTPARLLLRRVCPGNGARRVERLRTRTVSAWTPLPGLGRGREIAHAAAAGRDIAVAALGEE